MDRIQHADATAGLPAYVPAGIKGYAIDRNPGGGIAGTPILAFFWNMIQEEIYNLIVAQGIVPAHATMTQLREAVSLVLSGAAAAADTGVVTGPRSRAVMAVTKGQATGANSAVIASSSATAAVASGAESAVIATLEGTASGITSSVIASALGLASGVCSSVLASAAGVIAAGSEAAGNYSSVVACNGGIASDLNTVILASENAELSTPYHVGGGYSSGAAIVKSGADQNILWYMSSRKGHGYLKGGLLMDTATDTSDPSTIDAPSGTVQLTARVIAPQAETVVHVDSTYCAAASLVYAWIAYENQARPIVRKVVPGAGHFDVTIMNLEPLLGADTDDFEFRFVILNPATP